MDFSRPEETADRINGWVARKTQGFVPEVLRPEEIDPETVLGIANALYLQALWERPFRVAEYEMEFQLEDGSRRRVRPMEVGLEGVRYGRTELFQIVGIPYRGGELACYVVLPNEGLSVEALVGQLDAGRWRAWLGQLEAVGRLELVMPRFEVASEYDLILALMRLGIRRSFVNRLAEFTRILDGRGGGSIYLFKRVCRIRVDERGTEAGAGTVALTTRSLQMMEANRPFLFVVADAGSGAVLFMGVVRDPEG